MTKKTFNKYKLVIDEWFVNGFNGAKAYQKFYPKSTIENATVRFSKMAVIDKVEGYTKVKNDEAQRALRTTHKVLLLELENWAYSDITETILLTPEQVKDLPVEIRRLVTKFKNTSRHLKDKDGDIYETIETVELWFVSKEKAMEMIHKHTGFYEKDNTQKAPTIKYENVSKQFPEDKE